jgi:hypothetical protein
MIDWVKSSSLFAATVAAVIALAKVVPDLIKDIRIILEIFSTLFGNAKRVKETIPGQDVTMANMLQNSVNSAVDNNKIMMPGTVPIVPTTATVDIPKRMDDIVADDPRLQEIIKNNTQPADKPAKKTATKQQKNTSLIDGKTTYTNDKKKK